MPQTQLQKTWTMLFGPYDVQRHWRVDRQLVELEGHRSYRVLWLFDKAEQAQALEAWKDGR